MPKKHIIDLNTISRLHFIGIGGVGISALARLMVHEGKQVSGTNDSESPETLAALRRQGVPIAVGIDPIALPEADCYVYSDAWPINFPAVVDAACKTKKPTLSYYEMLGVVANRYFVIPVSGTHGKTTTTAMVTDVLEAAGLDPTAVVGSLRAKTKSNFRAGKGKYFVVEADEYRRHFLAFNPDILVITNIEADHLDYYKNLADIQDAFRTLARRVPEHGYIVCPQNDPKVAAVLEGVAASVIDYRKFIDPLLRLKMPGMHNLLNAGAALGVAHALKIDTEVAKQALEDFAGTWRRSEYIGETEKGAVVYDDYGHHPTEIEATLKGFREKYPDKRMVVAFQPHLHSRTKDFFDQFVEALALADDIILAPIFEARKEADHGVSSEKLARAVVKKTRKEARALGSYEEIAGYLRDNTGAGDLIITIGAGPINKVAEILVGKD
ncbi:UDP-N-acetylmuramate--L-alanine ligase [Candidatus Kaiserbacteria bacterium]|nr:UDP-N-acetylmuramate--L-alanine ligase [Candidatus Kaiserbacteria bacterium]